MKVSLGLSFFLAFLDPGEFFGGTCGVARHGNGLGMGAARVGPFLPSEP